MSSLVMPYETEELFISSFTSSDLSRDISDNENQSQPKNSFLTHIWEQFLILFEKEKGKRITNNWLRSLEILNWNHNKKNVSLYVPNEFSKKWLESNFLTLIEKNFARLLNEKTVTVTFVLQKNIPFVGNAVPLFKNQNFLKKQQKEEKVTVPSHYLFNKYINNSYTMEQFLVTKRNEDVVSAITYFIEKNNSWNQILYIYGTAHAGKSHLLQASREFFLAKNISILYLQADIFLKQYINSAKMKKISEFEKIFIDADILMIDDIEIFKNKKYTQEFLLKIINDFSLQKKKVIIAGKSAPRNVQGLSMVLCEKLEEGLIFHFELPSREDIKSILLLKAKLNKYDISDELIDYIVSIPSLTIAQGENILHRIMIESVIKKKNLNLDLVKDSIKELHSSVDNQVFQKNKKDIPFIMKKIKSFLDIDIDIETIKKTRNKNYIKFKYLAIYIMRTIFNISCVEVAKYFGYKDHTTLSYACRIFVSVYKETEEMKELLLFFTEKK